MSQATGVRHARPVWRTVQAWLFVMGCGQLLAASGVFAAERVEVHELDADPARYVGRPLTVEGRFRSAGAGRLSLVDSPIEFRLTDRAGQVRRSMSKIEVEGRLLRAGDRPVFEVDRFLALPDDTERFASQRAHITRGNYRSLFSLAGWARQRSLWYHDRSLAKLAAEAYREAFDWDAEEAIRLHDSNRLLFLAAWGEVAGVPTSRTSELRHHACLAIAARVPDADTAGRLAAAARIRAILPGTATPLEAAPLDGARTYLDDPAAVFPQLAIADNRQANPALRADLSASALLRMAAARIRAILPGTATPLEAAPLDWARIYLGDPAAVYPRLTIAEKRQANRALWADLTASALLRMAEETDADLDALAERAARELPDRPEAVRQLRIAALAHRAGQAAEMSRADVLRLRADLEELGEAETGRRAVEQWLDAARMRLAANDAEGRLLLAAEYDRLAGDRRTAATLLIDALRIAPELAEAEAALAGLGYSRREGVWQPTAGSEPGSESVADTQPDRPLARGDSEHDVLARLRRPDRVARVGSRNDISEQWIYDGPPTLHIYLRRSAVTGQAFVLRVESGP